MGGLDDIPQLFATFFKAVIIFVEIGYTPIRIQVRDLRVVKIRHRTRFCVVLRFIAEHFQRREDEAEVR
uniref:Uncharacterized protein n=1 Tax=Parascaris equorum TaxID=6256 RepID=A0A914RUQ8_PAREQ